MNKGIRGLPCIYLSYSLHPAFRLLLENAPCTVKEKCRYTKSRTPPHFQGQNRMHMLLKYPNEPIGLLAPSYFISIVFKDISACEVCDRPVKVSISHLPIYHADLITF